MNTIPEIIVYIWLLPLSFFVVIPLLVLFVNTILNFTNYNFFSKTQSIEKAEPYIADPRSLDVG